MLGLPDGVRAGLFDLDDVLTPTAAVHAAAWKELFDGLLRRRAERAGEPFVPFDQAADYDEYVDGKVRADGTRSFLASRGITLPEGDLDDPPERETVQGLSARKDVIFLERVHRDGVKPYEGSVRYLRAARDAGLRRAVVFEDALAEVAAGRAGAFGYVIGVDRVDQAQDLRRHAADVVVEDLADLLDES